MIETHEAIRKRQARPAGATPRYFTHAIDLDPNPLRAFLQLVGWIFFHPSAWQSYVRRLEAPLPPNFSLVDVGRGGWRQLALRRLLIAALGTPVLVTLLFSLAGILTGLTPVTVLFGVAAGLIVALMFSVVVSLATALVAGTVVGLLYCLLYGQFDLLAVDLVTNPTFGLIFGLAFGLTAHAATNIDQDGPKPTLARQAGSILLGLLISGGVIVLAAALLYFGFVVFGLADNIGGGWRSGWEPAWELA